MLFGWLFIVIGLLMCLAGYAITIAGIEGLGFVIGVIIGGIIGNYSLHYGELGIVVVGLLSGCLFAWLFRVGYEVVTFVSGAVIGGFLGYIYDYSTYGTCGMGVVVGAIVGGIVSLAVKKFVTILSTSALGALSFVLGVCMLKGDLSFIGSYGGVIGLILLVAGVVIQYKYTSDFDVLSTKSTSRPPESTGNDSNQ